MSPSHHPPRHRPVPVSRLWWFTAPVLVVLVAAAVVIGSMQLPYYTLSPGQARAVGPLVELSQVEDGPKVPI